MRGRLLNFLCCPYCLRHPLHLEVFAEERVRELAHYPKCDEHCGVWRKPSSVIRESDCADCSRLEIQEGVVACPQCERWYPVGEGIPSIFVDELRQGDEEFISRHRVALEPFLAGYDPRKSNGAACGAAVPPKEIRQMRTERQTRDEQVEIYDRIFALKLCTLLEVPQYRRALGRNHDAPLLEAGCGTGRLTPVFTSLAKEVVCVDLSLDSVKSNCAKHAKRRDDATVHLLHCDLTHLPLKTGSFERIANCQVYEHIPTRELRLQFLEHANRVLTDDGKILISAYRYGPVLKLFLEKEGEHPGGIPFFRFTPSEFAEEVNTHLTLERLWKNVAVYLVMAVAGRKQSS